MHDQFKYKSVQIQSSSHLNHNTSPEDFVIFPLTNLRPTISFILGMFINDFRELIWNLNNCKFQINIRVVVFV